MDGLIKNIKIKRDDKLILFNRELLKTDLLEKLATYLHKKCKIRRDSSKQSAILILISYGDEDDEDLMIGTGIHALKYLGDHNNLINSYVALANKDHIIELYQPMCNFKKKDKYYHNLIDIMKKSLKQSQAFLIYQELEDENWDKAIDFYANEGFTKPMIFKDKTYLGHDLNEIVMSLSYDPLYSTAYTPKEIIEKANFLKKAYLQPEIVFSKQYSPPKKIKTTYMECIDFVINKSFNIEKQKYDLYELLEEAVMDKCDIYNNELKITKLLEKESASNTIQLFGHFKIKRETEIFIKLSFQPIDENKDNSLNVERLIYKNVTNPLIMKKHTPHLIFYYGTLKCDNFRIPEYLDDLMLTIDPSKYDTTKMFAMILEKAKGSRILDRQHFKNIKNDDVYIILFQLLWTLECFNRVGMRHNDLHLNNFFVEKLEKKKVFYVHGDVVWMINSPYNVKIYDFDHSSKFHSKINDCKIKNTRLSSGQCYFMGTCNEPHNKFDTFKVLAGFYDNFERPVINEWIEQFISRDLLLKRNLAWHGMLCSKQYKNNKEIWCKKIYPRDNTMYKTIDMLHEGFEPFIFKGKLNKNMDIYYLPH